MKNKNWKEQFEDMINLSGTWWISREVANPRRMRKLIEQAISENSVNKKDILHQLFQFKRMGAISYEAWSVISEMVDSSRSKYSNHSAYCDKCNAYIGDDHDCDNCAFCGTD